MRKRDADDGLPWIPWFPRDWRASRARAVLISDEAACLAYRELLDAMWSEPGCSLPADDETLAALAGTTPEKWSRVKEKVLQFLPADPDGRRSHPRSRHEWRKAKGLRSKKSHAGKKGNDVRWGSHSDRRAIAQRSQTTENCDVVRSPAPHLTGTSPAEAEKTQKQNQIAPRAEPRSAAIVSRLDEFPAGPARDAATAIRDCSIPAWRDDPAVTPSVVLALLQIATRCDVVAEIRACQAWWATKPATTRGRVSCVGTLRNWLLKANERAGGGPIPMAAHRTGKPGGGMSAAQILAYGAGK